VQGKLILLNSLLLVLALISAAHAGTPIIIVNHSFELLADGNNVVCHTEMGHAVDEGVLGWASGPLPGTTYYAGVDVNCNVPQMCGDDCRDWHIFPDGNAVCYIDDGVWIYQLLDHNIVPGYKYTLTYDGMTQVGSQRTIIPSFYYLQNVGQPDVNHITLADDNVILKGVRHEHGKDDWMYDLKLHFVTQESWPYINKKLGIKFDCPLIPGNDWVWVDDVRLESTWASNAWDPEPADNAQDVNTTITLSWKPGLWAASHEVYFGTSESEVADANTNTAGIYRGSDVNGPDANNRFSYSVHETLDLGKTYYWRIDQVNDTYVGPAPKPWKGDLWSFTTTGFACNVYPPNYGTAIPALELNLQWQAGTDANSHDVYFGTSETEVADANTNTSGIFRGNQPVSDVNYLVPEDLDIYQDYFWRIDEVNTAIDSLVQGDIWRFTTGIYLIVDSFNFYEDNTAIKAVWKDYWADTASKNGADIFVETDPNFTRSGQSMRYYYVNNSQHKVGSKYVGSWAEADTSDLEFAGSDWTRGGIKALVLYFYGDPCNAKDTTWVFNNICQDQMWVALDDGSTEGVVEYDGDMNDIKEDFWHEWNVSLQDFNDAGVVMSDISKVYLGFGGTNRVGQSKAGAGAKYGIPDIVYFDDIRLYPPRCKPSITGLDVLHGLGDIGGEQGIEDCNTDYSDLEIIARDWLMNYILLPPMPPDTNGVVQYTFDEGGGTIVHNTGTYTDPNYNLIIGMGVDANHDPIVDPNNDPCWVNDPYRGWCLWFDGNTGHPQTNYVGDTGDYLLGPALYLNSNTVTLSAWIKPDPWCIGAPAKCTSWEQKGVFTNLVHTRDENSIAGIFYGSASFTYVPELKYEWNGKSDTWVFSSEIFVPDWRWSFVAVVIEPDKANLYLGDFNDVNNPNDDVLHIATHVYNQEPDEWDGLFAIACDGGIIDGGWEYRFFRGSMSDVRIYDYSLSLGEILALTGIDWIEYVPLHSPPSDINGDGVIDFKDYAAFANHWLQQHLWP
jgi:hypothetical protein